MSCYLRGRCLAVIPTIFIIIWEKFTDRCRSFRERFLYCYLHLQTTHCPAQASPSLFPSNFYKHTRTLHLAVEQHSTLLQMHGKPILAQLTFTDKIGRQTSINIQPLQSVTDGHSTGKRLSLAIQIWGQRNPRPLLNPLCYSAFPKRKQHEN